MKITEFKLDNLSGETLITAFQKDYWGTVKRVTALLLPQFTISDVGITHRWITNWDDQGLIDNRRDGTEWRRFSFVEYIWLRIIVRLREFNMSIPVIKQVKKYLFQSNSKENFKIIAEAFSENMKNGFFPPAPGYTAEEYEKYLLKNISQFNSELKHVNLLFLMIFSMQIDKKPIFLQVTENGQCGYLYFGDNRTSEASLQALKNDMEVFDFTIINLYKIFEEFFSNKKIKDEAIKEIAILNEKEKQILELIQMGDFKELSIKLTNNKNYFVSIKRNKSLEKITNHVSSLIARGQYQDIKIVTEKGKIVLAEITDKIKI